MEYAAGYGVDGGISGNLLIKSVRKVEIRSCGPLGVAEQISLNRENERRLSLKNGDLSRSGCFYAKLVDSLVGDGVNTLLVSVKSAVVLNNKAGVGVAGV